MHYVREQPVDPFLADPALAPFAVLADLAPEERPIAFRRGLDQIATVVDDELRFVLAQVALDLAGIRLDFGTIKQNWEESAMPVPSFLEQVRQEGREEGRTEMVAVLLRHRFGTDSRIPGIARRLAGSPTEDVVSQIEAAKDLDELI